MSALSKKKRSRKSEIALLESISSSLDNFISAPDQPQVVRYGNNSSIRIASADASRDAVKSVLATKTLIRSIVKVCAKEKAASESCDAPDRLVEALVDEYRENYPSLTVDKVNDALSRYTPADTPTETDNGDEGDDEGDRGADANDADGADKAFSRKVSLYMIEIDDDMDKYYDKIATLKRAREEQQEIAAEQERKAAKMRKKAIGATLPSTEKEQKQSKPRKPRKKDTPEYQFLNEVARRYAREKEKQDRIPNGVLEEIVEDVKKVMDIEHISMSYDNIGKKIRRMYHQFSLKEDEDPSNLDPEMRRIKMERALFDEVYTRYASEKQSNEGKLPFGRLDTIVQETKADMGMPHSDVNIHRIRAKFKSKHPDFNNKNSVLPEIRELSDETKRRRQLLINEITARYVREKEIHKGKLPDGTLDLIITSTKQDMGIFDVEVPKDTIRGRLARKSFHVLTLGKESPYKAIDEELVEKINSWLNQGISVTREQGLDLANELLRGRNLHIDSGGMEITLDARWWRTFLARNKRRLACSNE